MLNLYVSQGQCSFFFGIRVDVDLNICVGGLRRRSVTVPAVQSRETIITVAMIFISIVKGFLQSPPVKKAQIERLDGNQCFMKKSVPGGGGGGGGCTIGE